MPYIELLAWHDLYGHGKRKTFPEKNLRGEIFEEGIFEGKTIRGEEFEEVAKP